MAATLTSCIEDWKNLPWKKFQKVVFRLQCRIYKAQQNKDFKLVHRLQRLLHGSRAAKFLAIRQVTQLNTGKATAGVDGKAKLNEKERLELFNELNSFDNYKHAKLRRVFIPKPNGERRPLGIPTIKDRAVQCLIKYSLEPVYEAYASKGSWGFRPGRSTHDAMQNIFFHLRRPSTNYQKSILEVDIEKCFDRISHEKLMSLIHIPIQIKRIIKSALKAGVLNERASTREGTPQGGVISPLLCNIALHGIEDLWNGKKIKHKRNNERRWFWSTDVNQQRGVRYADDMVFFLNEYDDANELRLKIDQFLAERGLSVQKAKTRIVKSTEGFDFLGWRFEVKANNALTCWPSRKNRRNMIDKIKATMRDQRFTLEQRFKKVKVIYKGWINYHQYCDLSKINLWSINDWTYKYAKKMQSKLKRKDRAVAKRKLKETVKDIFNGHKFSLFKYTSVQREKSPFDGDWLYWSNRKHKQYWGQTARVLKAQKFKCASCNLNFVIDDHVELHHIDGNHKNNNKKNLEVLHRSCHQHKAIHGLMRRKGCP